MIEFFLTATIFAISLFTNHTLIEEIIPLKTDRAVVEELLGKSKETECSTCTYETDTDFIVVHFAKKKCEGELPGWNVSAGTVLSFNIQPKKRLTLEQIKLRTEGLVRRGTDDGSQHYIDARKGLKYVFSPQSELKSITRLPVDSDNSLRCNRFPKYNLRGATYIPVESYESIDLDEGVARIQNNLIGLRQSGVDFKLYALVYSGSNLNGRKFEKYLDKLRKELKDEVSESPSTLEIVNAGRKRRFLVEIFFVKKEDPPPCPLPDFPHKPIK